MTASRFGRLRELASTPIALLRRLSNSRLRVVMLAAGFVLFASAARCSFQGSAEDQTPRTWPDSDVYLDIAKEPIRFDHFFHAKPFFVPFVYRSLDRDIPRIIEFQQVLCVASWCLLGMIGCFAVRRALARAAIVLITFSFLLAPYRVGFASVVLSESINDSLMALVFAVGLGLFVVARRERTRQQRIACWVLTVLLAVTSTAWMLCRDTNAVSAIVAVILMCFQFRAHRRVRDNKWAIALVVWTMAIAGFALWSVRVQPEAAVARFSSWPPEVLARGAPPMVNNVKERVLRDRDARDYFVTHGMPQADELAAVEAHPGDPAIMTDPRFTPVRTWIERDGHAVYMRWLLRHPLDRTNELAVHVWGLLSSNELVAYMPEGWRRGGYLRQLTTSQALLTALFLVLAVALYRAWRHPLSRLAVNVIGSGLIGAAAAYYGDAIEIARHCYGSGQQVVLGAFLAGVAWLDRNDTTAQHVDS